MWFLPYVSATIYHTICHTINTIEKCLMIYPNISFTNFRIKKAIVMLDDYLIYDDF